MRPRWSNASRSWNDSKSAAAAEQARVTADLDAARRAREAADGVPAAKRGRGLSVEIALARHDSPNRGGRHLGFARALVHEMPYTLAALESGALSEWRATLIVRESACLSLEDRRTLDVRMCADQAALEGLGDKRIEADAKAIAYQLDPQAVVDKAVRAQSERTVTVRPAPDTMTYVTALLPMTQGVSVYAALKRAADTSFDGRSRGQVMADTLVERVTGHPADVPVPVAVNLVMTDETLLGGATTPAHVPGYGPVPAAIACRLVGRRRRRRAVQSHPAPALPPPRLRSSGRDGIPSTPVPKGSRAIHRASETTPAGLRIAMRRFGTPTTPPPMRAVAPPLPPTVSAGVRPATTPRKHPAGVSIHSMPTASATRRCTSRRPARATSRTHRHCPTTSSCSSRVRSRR